MEENIQTQRSLGQYGLSLFDISLFALVILGNITSIYVFSDLAVLNRLINILQIPIYLFLLWSILQANYRVRDLLCIFAVAGILLVGYLVSGQAAFFRGFLLIIAAKKVPFERIIRICRAGYIIVLGMGVFLWLLGVSDAGVGRRGSIAFGFVHPNIISQIVMLICLLWAAEKGICFSLRQYVYIELFAFIILLATDSKSATLIIAALPFALEIAKSSCKHRKTGKILAFFMTYSQVMMMAFTYISAKYLETSALLQKLDLVFTNRLFINYYFFRENRITLLGQNIALVDYSGTVYNNIHNVYNLSITCDSSYTMSLLIMGLIPTLIAMLGFILLMKKARKNRAYVIMAIAALLAVYAFCESQMLDIYKNFIYFYLMTFSGMDNSLKKVIKDNGNT